MGTFLRLNAAVTRATPVVMLVAYLVFFFSLYVLIPTQAFDRIWYTYITIQTLCILCATGFAISSKGPSVQARRQQRKVLKEGYTGVKEGDWPHIDVVLLAPAQTSPLARLHQAQYILSEVDYPREKLHLNVVYTGRDSSGANDIADLGNGDGSIRIVEAGQAASEADALNHFLSSVDSSSQITSAYSVNHVPHPDSLRFLAQRFRKGDVDVVCGRRCISDPSPKIVSRLASAEFDAFYGLLHPGRASKTGHGIFWGSNSHWSTSLLRALGQRDCETDVSLRALLSGARVAYDLNVVSFEPGPQGLGDWFRQNYHDSQIWTQMVGRHSLSACFRKLSGPFARSHLELPSLLGLGALYSHFVAQLVCSMISGLVKHPPHLWPQLHDSSLGFRLSVWLLAVNLMCIAVSSALWWRNRAAATPRGAIFALGLLSPFYLVITSFLAITSHFRALFCPFPSRAAFSGSSS
ncbi:unnamed protein product [Parajaminaea phylloscopi]